MISRGRRVHKKMVPIHKVKHVSTIHVLRPSYVHNHNVVHKHQTQSAVTEDVFYEDLKPIWYLFKVLGYMPLQRQSSGLTKFCYFSKEMCYSICISTLMYIASAFVLQARIYALLKSKGKLDKLIHSVNMIVWVFPAIYLPVAYCWISPNVARLFNDWRLFQENFYRVTTQCLRLSLRRHSATLVLFLALNMIFIHISIQLSIMDATVFESLFYSFVISILNSHLVLWFLLCSAASRSSHHLMQCFKKDFTTSKRLDSRLVSDYRHLWLKLSKLTQASGNIFAQSFITTLSMWCVTILLNTYLFMSEIIRGVTLYTVILAICIFTVSEQLRWFCIFGENATNDVGENVMDKLHEFSTTDKETLTELRLFETTVFVNPPAISLNGYVKVTKEQFISMWSVTFTYLVVLLQFQIGDSFIEKSGEKCITSSENPQEM